LKANLDDDGADGHPLSPVCWTEFAGDPATDTIEASQPLDIDV
jgi:hypothetical protein